MFTIPDSPGSSCNGEFASAMSADDLMVGRRQSTRYSILLSARFVSDATNARVLIEDLSATGAAIRLMHPYRLAAGRLQWLGFDQFADVQWQHDARCGLRFADPLPDACLARTLESGRLAAGGDQRMRRLAAAWAHGPGDY